QSRRLLHLLLAVVLTYGFFLGLPPFRFATTGGSSTFFGRPPLRLRGAGGSDETTAGSATGAAFPSLWAAILNRTRSPVVRLNSMATLRLRAAAFRRLRTVSRFSPSSSIASP